MEERNSEPAWNIAADLLQLAVEHSDPEAFLQQGLAMLAEQLGSSYAAWLQTHQGNWEAAVQVGRRPWPAATGSDEGESVDWPLDLLGDCLDREQPTAADSWLAIPLPRHRQPHRGGPTAVVLFQRPSSSAPRHQSGAATGTLERLVEQLVALDAARQLVTRLDSQRRRAGWLEEILEIAADWRQNQQLDSLLSEMAEAATRLLESERASIFLWDQPNRTLVGRPALGVEGGELRIPDDAGVVGQVLRSGEPRRVDLGLDQRLIDRSVDQQLQFETRTLLCVPLVGQQGRRLGVFEMINKRQGNFTDQDEVALRELARHAAVALENTQEWEQLVRSRDLLTDQAAEGVRLIGESPALDALRSTVRRVADSDLAVLILGENGTGKEVVSRSIHYLSSRRHQPLIAVNCAAITETLLESELFGHEKGAFTDARETRIGKFELASGGTLFLDEIGDMSLGGQAKLLRVLEEKVVVRVGGSLPIHTDARVIAATNQNLAEKVRDKTFREDLYYRLNVVTLELPPLRERGDDVLLLADHFLSDFCGQARRRKPTFSAAARKRLLQHSWPGNVRELRNLMERLAYLSTGDKIDADELSFILAPGAESDTRLSLDVGLADATREFQIAYIRQQIDRARGNMTEAAQRMGLHRSNLYRKMRQLEMDVDAP